MKRTSFFKVSRNNKKGIILLSLITLGIIFSPRILSLLNDDSDFDAESFPVENWNTKSFERKLNSRRINQKSLTIVNIENQIKNLIQINTLNLIG